MAPHFPNIICSSLPLFLLTFRIVCAVIPFVTLVVAGIFTISRFRHSGVQVVSEYTPLLLNDSSSDMVENEMDQSEGICSVAWATPVKFVLLVILNLVTITQFCISLALPYPLYTTVSSSILIVTWVLFSYSSSSLFPFLFPFFSFVLLPCFLCFLLLTNPMIARSRWRSRF